MKYLLQILLLTGLLSACGEKYNEKDDLGGTEIMSGVLTYVNEYGGRGEERVVSARNVYISDAPYNNGNYIYHVKTDEYGNFTFKRLWNDKTYYVFFADTIGGVSYFVERSTTPKDTLSLKATYDTLKQNAIVITVKDAAAHPVEGASVGIFNNLQVFESDSTTTQSLVKYDTDLYGRVIFYNLKGGKYFLRATSSDSQRNSIDELTIDFDGKGIKRYDMTLEARPLVKNKVVVITEDELGRPIPMLEFCATNNPLYFGGNDCTGKTLEGKTKEDGKVELSNVPPGAYRFYATAKVGNISYLANQQETIAASGDTVRLKLMPVAADNSYQLLVLDRYGTPVNDAGVYLFTSRALFNADTTLGNVATVNSGKDGVAKFDKQAEGFYFIRSWFGTGGQALKGVDSVRLIYTSTPFKDTIYIQ
ncbi:hypothetical protein MKQ68_09720 [Chitinophaga horti]|uniref:Carboxypeptidase regulatory-like domain-containing protein n=1 Tax=Chitinophaga horti TaxID=2920382 RepID=A0ABY6J6S1_9BACT|nr:hypothetical protein [Chitinophaga horti]UYQ95374.1 hypothetical protein MKQ68_09720 [Chitinophaga horti]